MNLCATMERRWHGKCYAHGLGCNCYVYAHDHDHSDTGTEAAPGVRGQYDGCTSCHSGRAVHTARRGWGGGHNVMSWQHGEGLSVRGGRGAHDGLIEGGVGLGISSACRARVGQAVTDKRGWGRNSGVVIEGGELWNRALVIVQVYAPTRGDL